MVSSKREISYFTKTNVFQNTQSVSKVGLLFLFSNFSSV